MLYEAVNATRLWPTPLALAKDIIVIGKVTLTAIAVLFRGGTPS